MDNKLFCDCGTILKTAKDEKDDTMVLKCHSCSKTYPIKGEHTMLYEEGAGFDLAAHCNQIKNLRYDPTNPNREEYCSDCNKKVLVNYNVFGDKMQVVYACPAGHIWCPVK